MTSEVDRMLPPPKWGDTYAKRFRQAWAVRLFLWAMKIDGRLITTFAMRAALEEGWRPSRYRRRSASSLTT